PAAHLVVGVQRDGVHDGRTVRQRRGVEFRFEQAFPHLLIEVPVVSLGDAEQTGRAARGNLEDSDEMKGARALWGVDRRVGRKFGGGFDLRGAITACPWTFAVPSSGAGASAGPAAGARASSRATGA